MKTKYFFATVKQINEQDKTLDAVASTTDIDRDNEMILPAAFTASLDSFKANPVILAAHQHRLSTGSSPVIGSVIPENIIITDNEVSFKMRFADTPLGEEYWKLYRDKHMRAFSIGFIPLEASYQKIKNKDKPVFVHTEIELLEISAVPVPSNRRALARAKGWFDDEDDIKETLAEAIKSFFENNPAFSVSSVSQLKDYCEQQFDEIKSLLIADSGELAERLLLGEHPDSFDPAGESKISEQLKRIEKIINA